MILVNAALICCALAIILRAAILICDAKKIIRAAQMAQARRTVTLTTPSREINVVMCARCAENLKASVTEHVVGEATSPKE